jgi:hypothetical protein
MRDLLNDLQIKTALAPVASAADNTAWVSAIIDRQGYDSAGFIILTGALPDADATFTVQVDHGDAANLSDAAAVADADLIGQDPTSATAPETQASFTFAADNGVRKIGYRGTKRYIRLTITPAANTSASLYAACAVLGNSEQKPVVQAAA